MRANVSLRCLADMLIIAALLALIAIPGANAQLKVNTKSEPVTVEADDGIEWVSDQKMYIARGNAKATRTRRQDNDYEVRAALNLLKGINIARRYAD